MDSALPTAPFGRTGHDSTRIIFGAAAFGGCSQDRADQAMEALLAAGVNHIDTAASYGDSELRLAPWMQTHRDRFFLATKTGERVGSDARAELERSLERLGVDSVDLIQLHNLVEDEEWETVHAPRGALEALIQARDEGLVRYIGVTGHGLRIPGMHLRSLAAFDYDSVLFPWNYVLMQDPAYRSDAEALVAECTANSVAIQTIKSIARRRWTDDDPTQRFSWYNPLDDVDAIGRAVRYVLSQDGLFLNTSSDLRLLGAATDAAADGRAAPTSAELDADLETYGITPIFDGGALERI